MKTGILAVATFDRRVSDRSWCFNFSGQYWNAPFISWIIRVIIRERKGVVTWRIPSSSPYGDYKFYAWNVFLLLFQIIFFNNYGYNVNGMREPTTEDKELCTGDRPSATGGLWGRGPSLCGAGRQGRWPQPKPPKKNGMLGVVRNISRSFYLLFY